LIKIGIHHLLDNTDILAIKLPWWLYDLDELGHEAALEALEKRHFSQNLDCVVLRFALALQDLQGDDAAGGKTTAFEY
jgi:hypothetical protein